MIVLMAGLPGTGKSTLARELVRRTEGALLSKDEIRAALFSPEDIEYSVLQDDFVMEVMLEAARFLLQKRPPLAKSFSTAALSLVAIRSIAFWRSPENSPSPGRSSSAPVPMNPLAAVSTLNPTPRTPRTTELSRSTSK
jgi:hypothetical protein